MTEAKLSCVRKEADQYLINNYNQLLNENKSKFQKLGKQLSLAGNEVRLKILWLLNKEELCVCDLSDILQMTIPAVSQHLRKLKDQDMVDFRRDGQTLFYFIHQELSAYVKTIINELSNELLSVKV